jgi:hypothetical protein
MSAYHIHVPPICLLAQLSKHSTGHSPIIGFMFDSFPIYGPYGFASPTGGSNTVKLMTSSYQLNMVRSNGPSTSTYKLGSFLQDYQYVHGSGDLDMSNGRWCRTPE